MSFIDKIKIQDVSYDVQDTEGRNLIDKLNTNKAEKTEIPTKTSELDNDSGFITSIPAEYITETELDEALQNIPTGEGGSAIPEITENTNIFDLETGVYYVNAGVTLTITNLSTTLDNEEPNIQIYVKSILNVLRCYDPENFSQVYYKLITFNGDTSDGNMVGYYEGYIDGSHGGSQTAWLCKYPVYMEMKNITTLANKVVELTSEATDEQYPSAKAVYDYVNSAIGTALDGEY